MVQWSRFSIILVFSLLFWPLFLFATEFTSTSFQVLDPVIQPGGYSTSDTYRLNGVMSQIAISTSTASSFKVNSGFLFYPLVSTTTVTATAGAGQVSLSWDAFEGFLGWTVSGYNVGQSTASGGPYSYGASLGDVNSATISGLTNGTAYYFVVRAEDFFVNSVATSSEVSATPVASASASTASDQEGAPAGSIIFIPRPIFLSLTPPSEIKRCGGADFNCDKITDIVDFSAFLYLSGFSPSNNPADINLDGAVDISDASIVFYHWTEKGVAINLFSGQPIAKMSFPQPSLKAGVLFVNPGKAPSFRGGVQKESAAILPVEPATSSLNLLKNLLNTLISPFVKFFGIFRL